MKGNEGPNLTEERQLCRIYRDRAAVRECYSTATSINAQEQICNAKALPLCPPPWSEHKSCVLAGKKRRGKSPQQAFLSLWTLFAALCWEELLADCRFLEVGQGRKSRGDTFPPYCYMPINPSFFKSLPIPLSVIPKAELSVTVLENPSALSGNGSHVSALI